MIPSVHLSLTAPGMRTVRLTQWALTCVMIGCLILTGGLLVYKQHIEEHVSHMEAKLANIQTAHNTLMNQARAEGIDLSDKRIRALPDEITFAKHVRERLAFSWTQFLNDLESAVPQKISMDSAVVNFKDSTIILSGSSSTLKALHHLVDSLKASPSFYHVVLAQHAIKTTRKPHRRQFVLFTMTVSYQPT